MAARHSSGTWMAALRLTKAESCGVDYDDELAPVKPPASFHASLANTNTLGCRAHYSGTAQPHLFFRLHLCSAVSLLYAIFIVRPTMRTSPALLHERKSTTTPPLSSPPVSGLSHHAGIATHDGTLHLPSTATCSTQRERDISRVYYCTRLLSLPASACHPF